MNYVYKLPTTSSKNGLKGLKLINQPNTDPGNFNGLIKIKVGMEIDKREAEADKIWGKFMQNLHDNKNVPYDE